nr:helitron helicase-like domain-containing protein [Tanacetum cinerariifolium]
NPSFIDNKEKDYASEEESDFVPNNNDPDNHINEEVFGDVYGSDNDGVPETVFGSNTSSPNKVDEGKENSKSEDPFGIYDILSNKKDNVTSESRPSLSHPPGFTPEGVVHHEMLGTVNGEANNNEGKDNPHGGIYGGLGTASFLRQFFPDVSRCGRIRDANANVTVKRQRLSGSSFISCPPINVAPSGVQNVPAVGGTALSTTGVTQPTPMSSRCGALPAAGTQSAVVPMFGQPEYVAFVVNNHSRARGDHTRRNPTPIGGSSSQQASPSGPPVFHNALVKLFRTTREKIQDNHVPNFQVRLYSVIGAQEYELPTRDMLGAIVYEVGPENDMDYDIMLEERPGYPKRVNKLHLSYMSLQFSLLFIYGQDGYYKDLKTISFFASSVEDKRLTIKVAQASPERTWKSISEDIPYVCSISLDLPDLHIEDSDLEGYMLCEFEACLNRCSKSMTDFDLRLSLEHLMSVLRNKLLMEETSYDRRL